VNAPTGPGPQVLDISFGRPAASRELEGPDDLI